MSAIAPGETCGVAVMAKASRAGLTKTRLAPCVGLEQAARLNTAFLKDAADNMTAAARVAPVRGYMAYGPPGEGGFFDFLPPTIGSFEAWDRDFGATLRQAFASLLARGHAGACLLNADSPTLPPSLIADAARHVLGSANRVVLGPSTDGGYYLIGASRLHDGLFTDIAWSTSTVFEDTKRKAARLGLEVVVLPTWYDVDDADSLSVLRAELFGGRPFCSAGPQPGPAVHTRELLRATDHDLSGSPDAEAALRSMSLMSQ